MTEREALKLVLEALENLNGMARFFPDELYSGHPDIIKADEAIAAAEEALAQPEQEPVAWEVLLGAVARGWCHEENANKTMDIDLAAAIAKEVQALYTTPPQPEQEPVAYTGNGTAGREADVKPTGFFFQMPPQRTWVGLTYGEKSEIYHHQKFVVGSYSPAKYADAIEAKLKEKNT